MSFIRPNIVRPPMRIGGKTWYEADVRGVVTPRIRLLHAGWLVLGATVALSLLGLYAIDAAGRMGALSGSALALRQGIFMLAGLVAAAVVCVPHYSIFRRAAWLIALAAVALLAVLIMPGVPESLVSPRNGARRWIDLGPFDLQPSELAKLAYVIVLAWYLRHRANHRRFLGLIPPALIALVPMGLIVLEPDLGTALLFIPAMVAMLVAAGAKYRHLLIACAMVAVAAGAVTFASLRLAESGHYPLLKRHQVVRIQALMDQVQGDTSHAQGRGFQGRQAMVLIGAGGVSGHPEAHSRALVRFSGLPERHNDMIFAVIVNRFGFIGAAAVCGLYLLWAFGAFAVAWGCKDPFGRILVVGLTTIIVTQALINMGETLGVLPITGMTLPFVSYGGSSVVTGFLIVGLIMNVGMRRPPYLWRDSFEYDREDER